MASELVLYKEYSRSQVHDIIDQTSNFTPGSGTWGLQGVINVKNLNNHFIFFVTYGRAQAGHIFQEGITPDGILSWQSQPRSGLQSKNVKLWINQQKKDCLISLFVRNSTRKDYIYAGNLEYLSHDLDKEFPVNFKFTIKEWRYIDHLHELINPISKIATKTKPEKKTCNNGDFIESTASEKSTRQLEELIDLHPEILGTVDGVKLEYGYKTPSGTKIPLIVHGPGKVKTVVSYISNSHDSITFREASNVVLMSVALALELGLPVDCQHIKRVLIASCTCGPMTIDFAKGYSVALVVLD